jgi:hypothetical protein
MIRRHFLAALAGAPAAALLAAPARAETPDICAPGGLALRGADPVAYFTEGAYLPGRPDHALMWRGAVWQFDRPDTMMAFEMNPTAFAPQFGGYCAFAMAHGVISTCDPRAFLVRDDALYLCSSPLAMAGFRMDVPGNVVAARANWPAILGG